MQNIKGNKIQRMKSEHFAINDIFLSKKFFFSFAQQFHSCYLKKTLRHSNWLSEILNFHIKPIRIYHIPFCRPVSEIKYLIG